MGSHTVKRLLTLLPLIMLAWNVQPAVAEDSLVGFVDMERIDREAPQIDSVRAELQKEFSERERE